MLPIRLPSRWGVSRGIWRRVASFHSTIPDRALPGSVFAMSWSSSSPFTVWPQGQSISFAMLFSFRLCSRTSANLTLSTRRTQLARVVLHELASHEEALMEPTRNEVEFTSRVEEEVAA